MKSGVYQIINKRSGKYYIGSAKDLETRKSVHFSLLNSNKHHSRHFQNAWNKETDKSLFEFKILELVTEKDDSFLKDREQYYLNTLCFAQEYINGINDRFLKVSYNIKPIANRGFYGTHSEETREKLSYANPNQKRIYIFDNNGNFIDFVRNGSFASEITLTSRSSLLERCHKKTFILKSGFLVCFEEDIELLKNFIVTSNKPIIYQVWNKGIIQKDKSMYSQRVKIKVIDTQTNIEKIYDSMIDFAKEINASNGNICRFMKSNNNKLYRNKYKIIKI